MYLTIKFGGETVSTGERIRKIADFLKNQADKGNKFVVVTSAMAGVTQELVSVAQMAAGSEDSQGEFLCGITGDILRRHIDAVKEAIHGEENLSRTTDIIEEEIQELEGILEGIEEQGELTDALLDLVMSFGERLSAPILMGALEDLSVPAKYFTGSEVGIVTNNNHLDATPLMDRTFRQIEERLSDVLDEGIVPVVTGFIAESEEGEITTMGRGSSDYSASLIGSALEVDEIWIMTDVDGIMTADPKIEPEAQVIDEISYLEATEMAHFGAEVLNPKTLEPAMNRDIPVHVKNPFSSNDRGTIIVHESEETDKIVKAITGIMKVSIVTVGGPSMIGTPGVASEVLETLARERINVLMISQSSSQANISFVINRKDLGQTLQILRSEFEDRHVDWKIDYDEKASVIASVGAGMKGTPGVAARVFSTMGRNRINILMISQGSSELNISFAIGEEDAENAVRALHEEFDLGS